jgi:hypothetical protein
MMGTSRNQHERESKPQMIFNKVFEYFLSNSSGNTGCPLMLDSTILVTWRRHLLSIECDVLLAGKTLNNDTCNINKPDDRTCRPYRKFCS